METIAPHYPSPGREAEDLPSQYVMLRFVHRAGLLRNRWRC